MVSDTQRNGIGGTTEAASAATPFLRWKHSAGGEVAPVSSRKLAASLWRLAETTPGGSSVRWQCADRLGFQFCSSMPIPRFGTEGATKWDCGDYFQSNVKSASAGQSALFKSRKHVNEGGWSRKMNEERASSMKTQWRFVINNLAEGVKTEKRFCKKMDRMNSNLLRGIAEAKLSARKLIRHLDKEKAAREELEDVCYDLAKEIQVRRAEIGALRNEKRRFEEEVEEERRMRQMAEAWREEQAQMKLADAKFTLEDKYWEVNEVIADLRAFLRRSDVDARRRVEVKDLSCMIPESDKAFAVIKDSETSEGRCCSNDQADCAAVVHFMSNDFKDASRRKTSEGSERRACMSKTKVQKGSQKSVSSISWMQPKSAVSPVLDARTNPHVVRAMTGHNQWRRSLAGKLVEAKFGESENGAAESTQTEDVEVLE